MCKVGGVKRSAAADLTGTDWHGAAFDPHRCWAVGVGINRQANTAWAAHFNALAQGEFGGARGDGATCPKLGCKNGTGRSGGGVFIGACSGGEHSGLEIAIIAGSVYIGIVSIGAAHQGGPMRLARFGQGEAGEVINRHKKKARAALMGCGAVGGKADLAGVQAKAGGDQIRGQIGQDREGQHRGGEFGLYLVAVTGDGYGDQTGFFFERNQGFKIPRPVLAGKMDGAADGGVACEGYLGGGEKDAHPCSMGGVLRRLHENRLGQIELARDGLHLARGQIVGV